MSGYTKKKLVGSHASMVNNSIGGDDSTYADNGGELRLRYSLPIWLSTFLLMVMFAMVFGTLVVTVYHYRHDTDAYVCNEDDRDRWQCDAVFEPDTEQCEELPYKNWATGGSFQACFYDICVYFKEWEPVIPYPCIGGEAFPEAGKEHCLDFIDPDYEKRDRLLVVLFCYDDNAVCIYRDKCSHYGIEEDEEETFQEASLLSQLDILNGTNFYLYGSQQALKNSHRNIH